MNSRMKDFIVTVEYFGLSGPYRSRFDIRARDAKSAGTKARARNRGGSVVSIIEAPLPKCKALYCNECDTASPLPHNQLR